MFISIKDRIINTAYIKEFYKGNKLTGDYNTITLKYIDGTEIKFEFDKNIKKETVCYNLYNKLNIVEIEIEKISVDKFGR